MQNVVVRLVEPYVGKTSKVSKDYFCNSLALSNKLLAKKKTGLAKEVNGENHSKK